jgi:hypothetical protein
MALDPSIFALFKPRSVADYQRDQIDLASAQQGQQLNALQLLSGRRKMEDEDRGREERNALARLMSGGFDRKAPDAQQRLYQTAPNLAPSVMKQWQEEEKTGAEIDHKRAETVKAKGDAAGDAIKRYRGALDYIDTPQGAARWLQAQYADPVLSQQMQALGPIEQAVQRIPADPQGFAAWRQQAGLGMEKWAEHQRGLATQAETKRSNLAKESQTAANDIMTPDGKGGFIPNRPLIGAKAAIAKAGATNLTVNATQEKEEAKTVGKFLGEQYGKIQEAGIGAQAKLDRAARMEQLLTNISTGKFEGVKKDAAAVAQAFGITIDPNLGDKEAFEALSNQLALEARNPSGGAGMPGAMSDKDREFLLQITPNLTKTPDGNRQIIETAKKLAKRDADVARLAREYRKKSGTLDEGFFEELRQFSDKTPLFGGNAASAGPKAGAVQGGYRFKGGNPADKANWEPVK